MFSFSKLPSEITGLWGEGAFIVVVGALAMGDTILVDDWGFCCIGAVFTIEIDGEDVIAGEVGASAPGVREINDWGKDANTGSGSSPLVTILLISNSCMILSGVWSIDGGLGGVVGGGVGGSALLAFEAISSR
jgi:hypothetical protein